MRKGLAVSAIVVTTMTGIAILTTQSNARQPPVSARPAALEGTPLESSFEPAKARVEAPAQQGHTRVVTKVVNRIPVSASDPQQGPADALVTMVVFGDFQDKFTRRAAETMGALRQKYGSDLRVVWKNAPLSFHEDARRAASLALEAFHQGGDELFWEAHRLLLEHQSALGQADLSNYAAQLGLDPEQTREALALDKYKAKLDADLALAPRLFPVLTTPLTTINGRFILGAESLSVFESTIDEELSRAKAQLASGTPRAQLYEELTKHGNVEPAKLTTEQQAAADKVYDL
ncbi:MAG: Periplasmic thiol disulfide interchange protein DsbA, partial [Myxococcaceae bacterium]|nr:Periplasmic thiol disulfide interchange protein DsbA [Myxococcaceae bacterium]